MALSLSNFLICCGLLPFSVQAAVRTFDWNIGWVRANPDGLQDRPTIGINGQWPLPLVQVDRGDRIVVNARNDLGNQTTSLHFHGLYMNGSTEMDGPVGATQCAVPPGSTFTYNFTVWHVMQHSFRLADRIRSIKQVLTGIIPMPTDNIQMVFVHKCTFVIPMLHTRVNTITSSS